MASLKGTRTEKNLLTAFCGESQARNRYTFFASVAKKEGYELISSLFLETANQEKEHAKRLFKFLEGGNVEITATFPAGVIGKSADNLEAAAAGEHEEWTEMYPEFARIAQEEGFVEIAAVMRNIAVAEKQHEKQYRTLWQRLTAGEMFKRGDRVIWRCRNCGFIYEGTQAPLRCPACNHPQAYFEVLQDQY